MVTSEGSLNTLCFLVYESSTSLLFVSEQSNHVIRAVKVSA